MSSKLYRIYVLEDGEIVRHKDFRAAHDMAAIRYLQSLRRDCDRELWDMSSAPARQVLVSASKGATGAQASSASMFDQA